MKKISNSIGRRRFLRRAACSSMGISGVVSSLSQLQLMAAEMNVDSTGSDYKALVVIFLKGGNDSANMLFPTESTQHSEYLRRRGGIRGLGQSVQTEATLTNSVVGEKEYAVHPSLAGRRGIGNTTLKDLPGLYSSGKLAFVANVGSLVRPIVNYGNYLEQLGLGKNVPPRLFSHSDQQLQWQTALPNQPFNSGWGGRLAELLDPGFNQADNSNVSMSISAGGINRFQFGTSQNLTQYAVSGRGAFKLNPLGSDGRNFDAFNYLNEYSYENAFEREYGKVVKQTQESLSEIEAALDPAGPGNSKVVSADAAFSGILADYPEDNSPIKTRLKNDDGLINQLKVISKLIAGRAKLASPRRQIFFCSIEGFDTHQGQRLDHAVLMEELKVGLSRFNKAMIDIEENDNVLLMTNSDFGRTITPNNTNLSATAEADLTLGTDHAWGGHQIVMGGSVDGGRVFGDYQDYTNLDPMSEFRLDVDPNNRGRYIPTTSVDQYSSIAAKWMGLGNDALQCVFPNLGNFGATSTEVGGSPGKSFDFIKST